VITFIHVAEWLLWINWLLLLLNIALPAFPLDGGRFWRAVIWPRVGSRTAAVYVARTAQVIGAALLAAAWFVHDSADLDLKFATLPLTVLGVLLFFSGRQEAERPGPKEVDEAPAGYEWQQEPPEGERVEAAHRPGPIKQWLESRRAARTQRQREIEEDDERRLDEVLARLHAAGKEALSVEDRALLARVSARYRNRLQH
jgi:hypothetical protein